MCIGWYNMPCTVNHPENQVYFCLILYDTLLELDLLVFSFFVECRVGVVRYDLWIVPCVLVQVEYNLRKTCLNHNNRDTFSDLSVNQ